MRHLFILLTLLLAALPAMTQIPGVKKPDISLDKIVVDKITDNERGILVVKNVVITGGACYNGARPSSYSVNIDQLWGDIVNTTTRQKYHLVYLETEWKSDSVCNVYFGLRGGPLPVPPGAISGLAQLSVQAYVVCIERFEVYRMKAFDIEVSN